MLVEIYGLTFGYNNSDDKVIKDFGLQIKRGEIIALLGTSGSGKSTVLRLIAGLEVPQSGLIKIQNRVVANSNAFIQPEERGVGMVFQDYALFPHMTVSKNIRFGLVKMSRKEKDRKVAEMLELVNLSGYGLRYPYELSGGQQQRVALARALAPSPSVLLLDEPFSNLDRDLQIKIRTELKDILKRTGITTIIVTHDEDDAVAVAERIIYIDCFGRQFYRDSHCSLLRSQL